MDTIGSRISAFREALGLKQIDVFRATGIKQQTLSSIESGTEPRGGIISSLLSAYPQLNPDWLLTGTGPMLRDGKALTPVAREERAQTTRAEFLPVSTATTVDNTLLQEVSASRDRAWEAAALAQRDAERAWTAAEQWRLLYFAEKGQLVEQQPTPTPEPAPPGKADADSHAAKETTPPARNWVGMPRRDADGHVLMHSDNFALLNSGEMTALFNPNGDGLSTIGVDEEGAEAA